VTILATFRVDELSGDAVVLHFGGLPGTIDARTLGEALLGFAEVAYAVSGTLDPGQEVEIVVEALGRGSFRTIVKRVRKQAKGLLSEGIKNIFWGVVAAVVFEYVLKPADPAQITINTKEVIIKVGKDSYIVPRTVYDASQNAQKNPAVERGVRRTFRALVANRDVSDFGITGSIHDTRPLVQIPRTNFPVLPSVDVLDLIDDRDSRFRRERARLLVIKPWLNHAKRKWSFEWNGVPISAPITDANFLDRIDRHEVVFGAGDALDAEIGYSQTYSPDLGIYENDNASYVISKVVNLVPRAITKSLGQDSGPRD
jgi:hypothetical protein